MIFCFFWDECHHTEKIVESQQKSQSVPVRITEYMVGPIYLIDFYGQLVGKYTIH